MTADPTGSCPLCHRRDPNTPPVCDLCRSRVAAALWEVRDLTVLLGAATVPGQSAGGVRVAGSRERALPLRIAPVDYAAPARPDTEGVTDYHHDQVGAPSVAAVLDSWVRDWSSITGEPLPSTHVDDLVSWLSRHLQWALNEHPAVADFAGELMTILYAIRALLNVSRAPIYLVDACGSCGVAALKRMPGETATVCASCGHVEELHSLEETAA